MEEDKSFTYEEVGRPDSEFVCWHPFTLDVDCLEYAVPIICHAIPEALADWTRHAIFELQRSYRVLERISYLEHSSLRFNLQSVRKLDIPPFKLIELDKNPSTTLTKHQINMEAIKRCSNIYVVRLSAWSYLTPAALDLPGNWDQWSLETKRDHVVRFYALEQLLKCKHLQELVFVIQPEQTQAPLAWEVVEWLRKAFKESNDQDIKIYFQQARELGWKWNST
jgi:hypothetical protein